MAYASAESKLILTPEDVVREFKFHRAAASNVGVKVARTGSILSPEWARFLEKARDVQPRNMEPL